MVKERSAWAPFSIGGFLYLIMLQVMTLIPCSAGPYGCIGRPLALLTVRTTLARIVATFDISFAPGEDGKNFEEYAKERFTIAFGDLMVSFKPRALV
jgi:tryprostatin B 6-hydroxylase